MEEKYKIHAFYILTILISTIIGLISVEWSSIPKLVDYITFALTVTSLCLALLAIIYSMQSNTSFSQNMKTLENSTNTLALTSSSLSQATNDLNEKVEDIPSIIKTVSDKVDATHTLVDSLSSLSDSTADKSKTTTAIQDDLIKEYLKLSSYNGLLSLYLCSLSHKTSTPFEYKKLIELASLEDNYSYAYIIASRAIGILKYEKKANDIWIINSCNKYLNDHISNEIDVKINNIKGDIEDNGEFEEGLIKNKKEIESYFYGET